jgi:hypothetical protein
MMDSKYVFIVSQQEGMISAHVVHLNPETRAQGRTSALKYQLRLRLNCLHLASPRQVIIGVHRPYPLVRFRERPPLISRVSTSELDLREGPAV